MGKECGFCPNFPPLEYIPIEELSFLHWGQLMSQMDISYAMETTGKYITVVGEQPYKSIDMVSSDSGLGHLLVSTYKWPYITP